MSPGTGSLCEDDVTRANEYTTAAKAVMYLYMIIIMIFMMVVTIATTTNIMTKINIKNMHVNEQLLLSDNIDTSSSSIISIGVIFICFPVVVYYQRIWITFYFGFNFGDILCSFNVYNYTGNKNRYSYEDDKNTKRIRIDNWNDNWNRKRKNKNIMNLSKIIGGLKSNSNCKTIHQMRNLSNDFNVFLYMYIIER